jgi:tetratricopeptide (TPR) repeat protein
MAADGQKRRRADTERKKARQKACLHSREERSAAQGNRFFPCFFAKARPESKLSLEAPSGSCKNCRKSAEGTDSQTRPEGAHNNLRQETMEFAKTIDQLAREKQYADAREIALQWTEETPKEPKAWNKLGHILAQMGLHAESLAAYEQSATLLPGDPATQFKIGVGRHREGNYAGAHDAFTACEKGAKKAGEGAEAYIDGSVLGSAHSLARLGRFDEAKKRLEKVKSGADVMLGGMRRGRKEILDEIERLRETAPSAPAARRAAPGA